MATFCLSPSMAQATTRPTNTHSMADYPQGSRSSPSPSIPLADVVTANENWRGKNDPAERRRIQNRLNQRAFRQRQRAGESPKQYKRRVSTDCSNSQPDDSDDEDDSQPDSSPPAEASYRTTSTSAPTTERPAGVVNPQTGQVWDELAQLINRNFLSAAVTNANHIGINLPALQAGTPTKTPRPRSSPPASLKPVDLQYQLPHDPIIDTIPHAALRLNILRAIAARQLDAAAFSRCLRVSGALEQQPGGLWQRVGVVVWNSAPEQVANWELSEPFVRRWGFLLRGCEDLIAATNAWRSRRGERLFPASVA